MVWTYPTPMSKSADTNWYAVQTILYLGQHPHPSYCAYDMHSTTFRECCSAMGSMQQERYWSSRVCSKFCLQSLSKDVGHELRWYVNLPHLHARRRYLTHHQWTLVFPTRHFHFSAAYIRHTSQFDFCRPRSQTENYQTSYVPSVISAWNNLPAVVKSSHISKISYCITAFDFSH